MKFAIVDWIDSTSSDQVWTASVVFEDWHKRLANTHCTSIGWLIAQEDDYIVLALSLAFDHENEVESFGHCLKIPKVSIVWMQLCQPEDVRRMVKEDGNGGSVGLATQAEGLVVEPIARDGR